MISQGLRFVASVVLGVLVVGCDSGPSTNNITGTVTFQGKPIDQGTINFHSEEGKLFGGGLQTGGKYSSQLPQGEFTVRIDAPAPVPSGWKEGDPLPTNLPRLMPTKFAYFRSSGLHATITADSSSHSINYEIE